MVVKEYYDLFPGSRALIDSQFPLVVAKHIINELQGIVVTDIFTRRMMRNIFQLNVVVYLERTYAYRSVHTPASEEAQHFRKIAHKMTGIETQQPAKFKQVENSINNILEIEGGITFLQEMNNAIDPSKIEKLKNINAGIKKRVKAQLES